MSVLDAPILGTLGGSGAPKNFFDILIEFLAEFLSKKTPHMPYFQTFIFRPHLDRLRKGIWIGSKIKDLETCHVGCLFTEKFGKKFNENVKKIFSPPLLPQVSPLQYLLSVPKIERCVRWT